MIWRMVVRTQEDEILEVLAEVYADDWPEATERLFELAATSPMYRFGSGVEPKLQVRKDSGGDWMTIPLARDLGLL